VPTMTAVGVAKPRAQGHDIASTAQTQHNNFRCYCPLPKYCDPMRQEQVKMTDYAPFC
jgi:hypothetical protein